MDPITLPEPPALPPGPVPVMWDPGTPEGRAAERHHRLAVLHEACPQCNDPDRPRSEWLAELALPQPPVHREPPAHVWTTPEGEIAAFVHGEFLVEDRSAFASWARANFIETGEAFAHAVPVGTAPWTRALFWLSEGRLHLETSSLDRWFHLEQVFEHLWPPVFRMGRLASPLDEQLDAPFRPHCPSPPAEASAFTRLVPPASSESQSSARTP